MVKRTQKTRKVLLGLVSVIVPLLFSVAMASEELTQARKIQEIEILNRVPMKQLTSLNALPAEVRVELGHIADTNEDWNQGCSRDPSLPSKGFVCAFVGEKRCWVSYKSGGKMLFHHLALYSIGSKRAELLWALEGKTTIRDLSALRAYVKSTVGN